MQNNHQNGVFTKFGNTLNENTNICITKASGSMVPPVITDNVLAAFFGYAEDGENLSVLEAFDYESFLKREGLA